MLKMEIHLELSVPSNGVGVNQVIALFEQIQDQLGPALARCYLERAQDRMLESVLGTKWSKEGQGEAPWSCPECGATRGFSRRGSYPRVLRKTSLGRVSFELRQVTCRHCGHTFSPFPDALELEPYQVSTSEFQAKAVEVACQTSYARTSQYMRDLAGVPVSATTVHQWVQEQGARVRFDVADADGKPVVVDSTKVLAGDKERGALLNLGLSIQNRYWSHGRPRLDVSPVCFGVGESWKETGQSLGDASPDRLVFDGDEVIRRWAEGTLPNIPKQRGVWHLVRQLYWPLWRDGLCKEESDPWLKRLGQLLYHPEHTLHETKVELNGMIRELSRQGRDEAVAYLAGAAPHAFTYRERPDGIFSDEAGRHSQAIKSTSPVERQMREINRRTDVGVRWSISGVKNLLALDLIRRLDQEAWTALWQLPEQPVPEYSAVKLQIQAWVEPSPNVKTT
jgi:hypothetical protein